MKTILNIDIDTDRKPQIELSKPSEMLLSTKEEAKIMIFNDIIGVTEALCLLIDSAVQQEFITKELAVNMIVERVKKLSE